MSDSGRKRKVRGTKIRSDREQKETRNVAEETSAETAAKIGDRMSRSDDAPSPDVGGEPFVETDEIARYRERVQRWLAAEEPVHLVGPSGCGKTALALEVARNRDRPVVWMNGDADLDTEDLVGAYAGKESYTERDGFVSDVVKKKEVVRDRWVDNPLTVAVREGATLVYNEFSRSKPAANNVLLSVFEEGVLELPGQRGEDRQVEAHPDFRTILTSNSAEYAGVHEPQDALLDRLVAVHLGRYSPETETEIVAAHTELPRERVETVVEAMCELREDDEIPVPVSIRATITAAKGLDAFPDDESLGDLCADVLAAHATTTDDAASLRDQITDLL
ncbi:gas vesicle protein GvpN [Halorussus halophilus]|uniref:gas vesicle protein GvpN n=1 Tax=Halorussus halophilus TaxID=2650975 RepID=UPI0013010C02|nr:gas vesicle protein GvpN [Halorussus halophilus]